MPDLKDAKKINHMLVRSAVMQMLRERAPTGCDQKSRRQAPSARTGTWRDIDLSTKVSRHKKT
jgi:hypothetical protein